MSQIKLLNRPIGSIGYGLMGLTWRAQPPSQSQAFDAMTAALAQGANFWNGGELYGSPERNSCHLLAEYFEKYPEQADTIVLSIKGGLKKGQLIPDGSEENVRRSVEDCLRELKGRKSIDIFQCARVDPDVAIEDTISYLAKLVKEGKIGAIGLSEVSAKTIERAAKVHPIAAVEVELSLWATDILRNGVAETCARLDIPTVAYSPLMRGALTDDMIKRNADIPADDMRKYLPKFQDDVLTQNNKLTEEVERLAKRKGVTKAQVAIAWVKGLSGRTVPDGKGGEVKLGMIIPIPGATTRERVEENTKDVALTDEEMKEIAEIVKANPVKGERYQAQAMAHIEG
jgi:pyridoxine 4-dehydrogenase